MTSSPLPPIFPDQTPSYILSFQFSSWYPHFSPISIKSSVIRPLSEDFQDYLNADGVFVPEGSEDVPAESNLSDDEGDDDDDDDDDDVEEDGDDSPQRSFSFPELDKRIRECIQEYGAVFPKLNFSSPRDASWVLPMSSPLKCTSPSDVYLLLKSSDFITHDLNIENVFWGCENTKSTQYHLELVLRKWYPVDCSREVRCFVRQNMLIAISQRDNNYYDFLNEPGTQDLIKNSVQKFWEANIRNSKYWESTHDYVFDFLLTRDLARGHIVDFNPYAPQTDPLLFTYEELVAILHSRLSDVPIMDSKMWDADFDWELRVSEFRVIDSQCHPAATSNAPLHQHNMVPLEALSLGYGRNIEEFAKVWQDEIQRTVRNED